MDKDVKNMENENLKVDVEGVPVLLALRNVREGIRADVMPSGGPSSPEEYPETVDDEEDETEYSESRVASGQGRMTAKIMVYDVSGNLVEVRIVTAQEEILRLLDRDISPVLT